MIQVCHRILSFREVAAWAEKGVSVRLLLRHSMRRSLTEGTLDPGLTPEGTEYALSCGKLLAGLKDLTVGSSPRLRCHETAQCLIRGGDLPVVEPVRNCAEIGDDAMFLSRETLEEAYQNPDLYKNLVVRVGGYSEYFHRLSDELKRMVIDRSIQNEV